MNKKVGWILLWMLAGAICLPAQQSNTGKKAGASKSPATTTQRGRNFVDNNNDGICDNCGRPAAQAGQGWGMRDGRGRRGGQMRGTCPCCQQQPGGQGASAPARPRQ